LRGRGSCPAGKSGRGYPAEKVARPEHSSQARGQPLHWRFAGSQSPLSIAQSGDSMQQPKLLAGDFNHLRKCRHGYVLYNINDMYVGRSFDLYGEFSEEEALLFEQVSRPGDVVMDIGANIGAHTLVMAKRVGPTGKVLAFEPQRVVFQTL